MEHRRHPGAQPGRPARRDGHQPVGRGARLLLAKRWSTRCIGTSRDLLAAGGAHRRVLLLSAPSRRQSGRVRARCDCRKPGAAWSIAPSASSASIRAGRSRSAIAGSTSRSHARSARAGVLVRTGYGLTEEQKPRPDVRADAVVDNLAEAAGWILRKHATSQSEIINAQIRRSNADRSFRPSAARRSRAQGARLLAPHRRVLQPARARRRRPDRRRVHLRRGRPRLARGAGPHPEVRRDGGGAPAAPATRRTTSRRSAAARRSRASSAPIGEGRRLLASFPSRRRIGRWSSRERDVSDAGQDAHPRRRRPLGEAAGRAHRSRDRAGRCREAVGRAFGREADGRRWPTATPCSCRTTDPDW